jgi:hypothetical protein
MLHDLFDKFLKEAKYIMNHSENPLKARRRRLFLFNDSDN